MIVFINSSMSSWGRQKRSVLNKRQELIIPFSNALAGMLLTVFCSSGTKSISQCLCTLIETVLFVALFLFIYYFSPMPWFPEGETWFNLIWARVAACSNQGYIHSTQFVGIFQRKIWKNLKSKKRYNNSRKQRFVKHRLQVKFERSVCLESVCV